MAKIRITKSDRRPPVVVVLGHVDHGKTTLLDTIRKTHVVTGETGGITQHIGAYQTYLKKDEPKSLVTFIDTPGHEAFSKMRSRGAMVADIAILVVAANEGVKPQTKEAIAHIQKVNIPFIIALNKIDVEGVNLDIAKSQLAEAGVLVEGYGGEIVAIPISAQKGTGVNELLEMIGLIYEMQEIKQENNLLKAVVLESFIDPHKGVIANILIRNGELKVGQQVMCEDQEAKVRSLLSDKGEFIQKATVSQPVQLLGFKDILSIGSILEDLESVKLRQKQDLKAIQNTQDKQQKDNAGDKKIKIILKTDVAGTLEAIKANLTEEIELVGEGIGEINESDILLAASTDARLIGFHIGQPNKSISKLAEMEEVKIYYFDVIYHLLEDLQKRVLKLIEPTINEEILGKAEIIAEFKIKNNHIAGCMVKEGKINRSEKVRILRADAVVAEPRIGAMQVERQDVLEAKVKQEVALVFRPDIKFKIGDTVISYKIVDE